MKYIRYLTLLFIVLLACNCHPNNEPGGAKLSLSSEFKKLAWMEGIWSNPDDSTHIFIQWLRKNDSVFSGYSWELKGKDSIPTEIHEISSNNHEILLSLEVFGKNDGNPDEYKLVTNKNGEHVFESSGKDFPQRLIYLLKPDGSLYYRIEGTSNDQPRFEENNLIKTK